MAAGLGSAIPALLVLVAGCAQLGDHPGATAADCSAQVRVGDVVFTAYTATHRRATRYAEADRAECHDVGEGAAGSVFPADPQRVPTWRFDGYPTTEVLGVRLGQGAFTVFVADRVPRAERDRILAGLGRRVP